MGAAKGEQWVVGRRHGRVERVEYSPPVDLSAELPFEGWWVPGWILAMSNRVKEMMTRMEAEREGGRGGRRR